MSSTAAEEVLISDVGPRDGLQSAGVHKLTIPVSASAPHSLANVRQSRDMHNTRRLDLVNCLAAFDVGVCTFDSSLSRLGGCPDAPGASGNVATEDLVFLFEAMGVRTGVDINRLIAARALAGGSARRAAVRHDGRGRPAQGLRAGAGA